ncbi:mechanosensitive ion channel [Candidatus Micrarchaeota archaeon]|nr:mechanosensitive ion channel [Candidatus Micrarchaeota archaeon]
MNTPTFLVYLAVILVMVYALPIIEARLQMAQEIMIVIDKILRTVLVVLIVFGSLKFTETWMTRHLKLSEDERRYITGVQKYLAAGLVLILLGFIYLGDISSLTLFSGLVGAGVAIAVQPALLNLIGWVSIVASRLYKTGDRVFIGDSMWGVLGDISDITLFFTRINELDRVSWQETGGFASVPNSMVLNKSVVNYTAESPFIWDEVSFKVTYGSDYELAKKLAEDAVKKIVGEKMRDAAKFLSLRKYKLKIKDIKEEPLAYVSMEGGAVRVAVRYLVAARKRRQAEAQITENLLKGLKRHKSRITVVG